MSGSPVNTANPAFNMQSYTSALNFRKFADQAISNLTERREDIYRDFFAGGIAGAVSRSAVAPLERLKIMFMCGGERVRQCGVVQALKNIYSHEGFPGFFRGNAANVARIYPFTAVQLSSYPFFKSVLTVGDEKNMTVGIRFWSGVSAGVLATFVTYPLDFIRCRLSMQTEKHAIYNGMVDGLVKVVKQEGFLSLYRGLGTSMMGIVPYAGIQLSTYDYTRTFLQKSLNKDKPDEWITFIAGSVAGCLAQTAAYPLEVTRRRLQIRGFMVGGIVDPNAVKLDHRPTFMREFMAVVRENGVFGLYRGLSANMLKIVPAAGINFLVFEYCKGLWSTWRRADKAL